MKEKAQKTDSSKEAAAPKKAAPSSNKAVTPKTPNTPPKQKSGSGIGWLAIILVLAATGAGYVAFTQLKQQLDEVSGNTSSANQSTSELSSELQSTSSNISNISAGVSDLSAQLATLKQTSGDKINLLQKQVGKNRRQWLIAEAEYLTSVANTRLQLAGDLSTAIVALQAADQRLKENGDPMTFAVRKQLAKEINILKSTELPDTVGISSQLIALEDAVSSMSISAPHAGSVQAPEIGKGDPSPIPENIQDTLSDAWANFSKLVIVRRSDEPLAALMTPERVELIRKNLALKLESARLALINQNEALYTASIAICMEWLGDYFDPENPSVKTAIEQLSTLKETAIKAELPSIALSLKMLRDLPLLAVPEHVNSTPKAKPIAKKPPVVTKPTVTKKATVEKKTTDTASDTKKADEPVKATH